MADPAGPLARHLCSQSLAWPEWCCGSARGLGGKESTKWKPHNDTEKRGQDKCSQLLHETLQA